MNVQAGESIFIPSGRIHAIGGGNLILEIQQNSDTTYRVYDWGRVGLDGAPRELHIEESLKSSDFNDFEPATLKDDGAKEQILAKSDVFNLRKLRLSAGDTLEFAAGEPRILSMVSGKIENTQGNELTAGDNALLPASNGFSYSAMEDSVLLITEDFA